MQQSVELKLKQASAVLGVEPKNSVTSGSGPLTFVGYEAALPSAALASLD